MDAAEFDRNDFIYSFGQVWKKLMTDPQGFFLAMPLTGGLANPFVFATLCLLVTAIGFLVSGYGLRLSFALILWGVIGLFLGAALLLLIAWKLFAGKGDYEATFRALAYAIAPVVLLWIPLVRYVAALYTAYLLIVGLQRAHEFDNVKAVLTVLVTMLVGFFLTLSLSGPGRLWPPLACCM